MDMEIGSGNPSGIEENDQQQRLLAWATAKVDQLADGSVAREALGELLDWVAYFTREHFGFQERLLNECGRQREYFLSRVAVHCEFRKKLAQLCVDIIRRDPTVPERLRSLCHELQHDLQSHDEVFSDIVRTGVTGLRLRRKPRRGQLVVETAQFFDVCTDGQVSESAAVKG